MDLNWTNSEDIGIQLSERILREIRSACASPDLHKLVTALPNFKDDPKRRMSPSSKLSRWHGTGVEGQPRRLITRRLAPRSALLPCTHAGLRCSSGGVGLSRSPIPIRTPQPSSASARLNVPGSNRSSIPDRRSVDHEIVCRMIAHAVGLAISVLQRARRFSYICDDAFSNADSCRRGRIQVFERETRRVGCESDEVRVSRSRASSSPAPAG